MRNLALPIGLAALGVFGFIMLSGGSSGHPSYDVKAARKAADYVGSPTLAGFLFGLTGIYPGTYKPTRSDAEAAQTTTIALMLFQQLAMMKSASGSQMPSFSELIAMWYPDPNAPIPRDDLKGRMVSAAKEQGLAIDWNERVKWNKFPTSEDGILASVFGVK